MRYFLLGFLLLCVAVVAVAGFRGGVSRKPPIELIPDMDRQPKLRPQAAFNFFPDKRSSRLPVAGTIAQSEPLMVNCKPVYPFEEHPVNTGRETGSTNWVETIPVAVTESLLSRGQERYAISCLPCHGGQGDGKGITSKFGMAVVANLHDQRIVRQADGEIYNTITHGKNLMGGYGANISIEDRWAITAYVRALQRSRLGSVDDVPADQRAKLPGVPPSGAK